LKACSRLVGVELLAPGGQRKERYVTRQGARLCTAIEAVEGRDAIVHAVRVIRVDTRMHRIPHVADQRLGELKAIADSHHAVGAHQALDEQGTDLEILGRVPQDVLGGADHVLPAAARHVGIAGAVLAPLLQGTLRRHGLLAAVLERLVGRIEAHIAAQVLPRRIIALNRCGKLLDVDSDTHEVGSGLDGVIRTVIRRSYRSAPARASALNCA